LIPGAQKFHYNDIEALLPVTFIFHRKEYIFPIEVKINKKNKGKKLHQTELFPV
jgi:hypothetical protein